MTLILYNKKSLVSPLYNYVSNKQQTRHSNNSPKIALLDKIKCTKPTENQHTELLLNWTCLASGMHEMLLQLLLLEMKLI